MAYDQVIDAEAILAQNIKDEAAHQPTVAVPQPVASDIDVTEAAVADEFSMMQIDDTLSGGSSDDAVVTDDSADDGISASDDTSLTDDDTTISTDDVDENVEEEQS